MAKEGPEFNPLKEANRRANEEVKKLVGPTKTEARTDAIVPVLLVRNDEYWLPYCLRSVQGVFSRFIIYDVGSEDATREVIDQFIQAEKADCDIIYRPMPFCDPVIQGSFRNAMIAEANSDWYLILDADEIYRRSAMDALVRHMSDMKVRYDMEGKIYGVVKRWEVSNNLKEIHGLSEYVKHHRIYHRTATWKGPHPGEAPVIKQTSHREHFFPSEVGCYHFHQPERSTLDSEVPRRLSRRYQKTYVRGKPTEVNLFDHVPLLQKQLGKFEVNPLLKEMQDGIQ